MYNKILVPLDGSELSECTLEHVKNIVSGCKISQVILLRVVEPLSAQTVSALAQAGGDLLSRAELDNQNEARDYLNRVSQSLKEEGIHNEMVLTDGNADDEILEYANKNNVDMVVMSTHGKSGVSRWFFGSVADRVVRHSTIPVLLISPTGCRVPHSA